MATEPLKPVVSGYCWRLPACRDWRTSRDEQWRAEVETHSVAVFVGTRRIDGFPHSVFKTDRGGWVAVLPQNVN